ncbi:hypothetical protein [Paractinoplanes toevensis]|uniref:Uncharacterized protein n=1 Tax=Paractinoplanes toevensis TaxID=571911 RepID=A0A919W002_9ACTN|nr:hypothetical protein [Actinoplanes toevensis]GIM90722.1 hypothetical protein Ato02nite_025150 [Actinoplanes toevensis]
MLVLAMMWFAEFPLAQHTASGEASGSSNPITDGSSDTSTDAGSFLRGGVGVSVRRRSRPRWPVKVVKQYEQGVLFRLGRPAVTNGKTY